MADFLKALTKHGLDVSSASDVAQVSGWLDTGNWALNRIVSGKFSRGWPLGRVVEIFGDPSTGKTFLIARAIASALSGGGVALLDDSEGSFNAVWAALQLGVDTKCLAYVQSDTVEEHFAAVKAYTEAMRDVGVARPSVLALDSLALLSTAHEKKVGMTKASMTKAKDVKKMLRLTAHELSTLPAVYLITNHTIANIGDFFHDKTTPGGGGVKFQATVRVELRNPAKIKVADRKYVGVRVRAFVEKNRLTAPWKSAEIAIPFNEPISPYSGLIPVLLDLGVLTISENGRSLIYQEQETKIPPYKDKDNFLKQDAAAARLVEKYPDILTVADSLDESVPSLAEAVIEEEEKDVVR